MPNVNVNGVGVVNFPDSMSEADIKSALDEKFGSGGAAVAAPIRGAAHGLEEFAGSLPKALAGMAEYVTAAPQVKYGPTMSEFDQARQVQPGSVPIQFSGDQTATATAAPEATVPIQFSGDQSTRPIESVSARPRTALEVVQATKENPLWKIGQTAQESVPMTPEQEKSKWTRVGEMVGQIAPVALGPFAVPAFAASAMGSTVEDFDRIKSENPGISSDEAADKSIKESIEKGALTATVFAALPPVIRGTLEKYLVAKVGAGAFSRWAAGRASSATENAALMSALNVGYSAIEGKAPDKSSLADAAKGGTIFGLLIPWLRNPTAAGIHEAATPEEAAVVNQHIAQTGMTPSDHAILNEAIGDKPNVKVLKPEQEGAIASTETAEDSHAAAQDEVGNMIFGGEEKAPEASPEKGGELELGGAKKGSDIFNKTSDLVKQANDVGIKPEQIARMRNEKDLSSAIEMKRRINDLQERAKSTQEEVQKRTEEIIKNPEKAAEPIAAEPADEAAKGKQIFENLGNSKNAGEMMSILDGESFQSLPADHKAAIIAAVEPRLKHFNDTEKMLTEQAKIRGKIDQDDSNPFSEERSSADIDKDSIARAARSGNVVAMAQSNGQITVFPKALSKRINRMRSVGYSDSYIKNNVEALIAHEQIHTATPDDFASEYWNNLSGFEKWAHQYISPSGELRSPRYMGHEAFRMRVQDILGMSPDDISNAAGTTRLKLDAIYAMQKGVRIIRENLLQRGVRGRSVAMIREVEIKLNMAERAANSKVAGLASEERETEDRFVQDLDHAADEYRDDGDKQTYNELKDRADWQRQQDDERAGLEKMYGGRDKLQQKIDFIKGVPKPSDQDTQVIVNPPVDMGGGKTIPGYVQIDDVANGKNAWSASPRLLRYLGFNVPDEQALFSLGGGRMSMAEAKSRLGPLASEERPQQDRFSFSSEYDPKPPAPLTPEQQAKSADIARLNAQLNQLKSQRAISVSDHKMITHLEQQLGQGMMQFSEERPGEFELNDPRLESQERRGAPTGKRQPKEASPQQNLLPEAEVFGTGPAAGALARQHEIETRTEAEKHGDFSRASQIPDQPTLRPFRVQESVENAAAKVIDDKLSRAMQGMPANLDTSVRALYARLEKQYGIQPGQVKELIASAFFKRIGALRGSEIDALLNSELKGSAKGKQYASAESAGGAEQSRELSPKEKGVNFKGTPDEATSVESEEVSGNPEHSMTLQMLKNALGGKLSLGELERLTTNREEAQAGATAATLKRQKDALTARRAELQRKIEAGEHIHSEAAPKTKEPLREAPEATVKYQDERFVKAIEDLRNKRLHRLFMAVMRPLLRETQYVKEKITPDDLRLGGSKDADSIETFQDSDQHNVNKLERLLSSGSFRSSEDPKTASQRLAVLVNKNTGRTYMVSAYNRDGTVYIVDPLHPQSEHAEIGRLLPRYNIRHSLLLDEPVMNFKQSFDDYADFRKKFLDDAIQMNEHAKENYGREPISDREAIEMAPFGIRIGGKKRDEFGHEADINDPQAEKKILEQRSMTRIQKMKRLREIEAEEHQRGQDIGDESRAESIALRQQIDKLNEDHPQFSDEFEGFHTQVKGTKSWYGPFSGIGDIAADVTGSSIKTKGPITRNEAGALFDYMSRKGGLTEDEIYSKIKEKPTNPVVINALGKFGRTVFLDHFNRTRERQQELRGEGDKETAALLEPRLRGDSFVREIARRLARGFARFGDREKFSDTMVGVVNKTGAAPPENGAPSPTGRELTYGPTQHRLTKLEQATGKTLPKLAFSERRASVSNSPDAATPEIPEATTQGPAPTTEEAIQARTLEQESNYKLSPSDLQYLNDSWAATRDENGDPIKVPEQKLMPKGFDYWRWLEWHKEISRMESEGETIAYSENRAEKALDVAYGLSNYVRAQFARRGAKDTLARGIDGASTTAANQALSSGHQINYVSDDIKVKAAANPMIAAKAILRLFQYDADAKTRAVEISNERYKEFVDLSKALLTGEVNRTKRLLDIVDSEVIGADKVKSNTPEGNYVKGLKARINNSLISQSQLLVEGSRLQGMIRSSIERQLVDEGKLDFRTAKYSFDESQKYKLDLFKRQVQKAIDESNVHMQSKDRSIHRMGRERLEAAKTLMQELDDASSGWNDKTIRKVATETARELDTAFATEKAAGYDARYDDSFMPGRYDAEFFNNDGVSFGDKRVLGLSFGAKTFENYYDAIAAGPYIAMSRDPAAMVEHRVRQGLTKLNTKAWEEGWKGMTDEHTGAPVAVGVKHVGNKDVPDPPRGVVGARYEIVKKNDGTSMAVLYGYHRLFRQLTEPSAVMDSSVGRAALYASQFLKHTVLAGDFFHFGRVGFYATAVGGLKNIKRGQYDAGWAVLELRDSQLNDAVKAGDITQSQADWARGKVAYNTAGNKGAISRINLAKELQKNGMNVGQIQDALYRDLSGHMPILGGLNVKWSRFLFDKWTRGLMTKSAIAEFERISGLNPEKDSKEVVKTVARDMNNFFGSIGRQGWIRSRTFQDISRMALLAPQWFEGIVKKDFAIPYKLMTGINNGKALEMLKGQESIGRGIARGLLFMVAATQVVSLIMNRRPTWQNDDKDHMFDVALPNGVYMSPLSVYNEIMHDVIRYGETKPKVWDAIQQIGENKLGFYGRAALVMATDKKGSGEALTSTGAVAAEVAKQFLPLPITLKGPISAIADVSQGRPVSAQNMKAVASLSGLKMEVGRNVSQQVQASATKFLQDNNLQNTTVIMTPTDEPSYANMRHAIEQGDVKGAAEVFKQLEQAKTRSQIFTAMREWSNRPFTGSTKNEVKWKHSLDEGGLAQYRAAIQHKRDVFNEWRDMYSTVRD